MKKLYRLKSDSKIAGVCGGIGNYFNVDSNIIRIAFILITILTGIFFGIVAYLLFWWLVPEK